MDYPLQSMLRIRVTREERAGADLTAARRARTAAERELEARRQDRAKYLETREARRDRIYEQVLGRPVSMERLDEVRAAVTQVDEEGVLLEQAERKAQDAVNERARAAESARVQFVAASRNRMKIDEHRNVWTEEVHLEEERAADAEMEEFAGRRQED